MEIRVNTKFEDWYMTLIETVGEGLRDAVKAGMPVELADKVLKDALSSTLEYALVIRVGNAKSYASSKWARKTFDWDMAIPVIETALGFKLYDWQKEYLYTGNHRAFGRATGRTTAYCIRLALTHPDGPIQFEDIYNFRDEEHGTQYHRWFTRFFMDIWERFKEAGLPVVEIHRKEKRINGDGASSCQPQA